MVSGKSTPDTIKLQRLPDNKLTIQERKIGDKSLKITVTGKIRNAVITLQIILIIALSLCIKHFSCFVRKPVFGVSDKVQLKLGCTQPQKMVRCLKFWIKEVKKFYYLCSENKGADEPCGFLTAAALHLCFHICKKQVFS